MEKEKKNLELENIVSTILADYKDERIINRTDISDQPDRDAVNDILGKIIKMIFPGYIREKNYKFYNLSSRLTVLTEDIIYNLKKQIAISLIQKPEFAGMRRERRLPES